MASETAAPSASTTQSARISTGTMSSDTVMPVAARKAPRTRSALIARATMSDCTGWSSAISASAVVGRLGIATLASW